MKRGEIDKLDELWATILKDNAKWTCEFCGIRGVRMEAAHVVGRRYRATRWGMVWHGMCDIDKEYDSCGHCLCHNCHQQYDEHGPLEDKIVEKVIGADRKRELQAFANVTIAKDQTYEGIEQLLNPDGEWEWRKVDKRYMWVK